MPETGEVIEGELMLRNLGTLAEAANHTDLKNKAGVYLMRCAGCSKAVCIGKSKEVLVRLITHAYVPPYGAVDLVIGEVLRPDRRDKWSQLCEHLKAVSSRTRVDVSRALKVEVSIPDNPAGHRPNREHAACRKSRGVRRRPASLGQHAFR